MNSSRQLERNIYEAAITSNCLTSCIVYKSVIYRAKKHFSLSLSAGITLIATTFSFHKKNKMQRYRETRFSRVQFVISGIENMGALLKYALKLMTAESYLLFASSVLGRFGRSETAVFRMSVGRPTT